jgi:hypothetical protein
VIDLWDIIHSVSCDRAWPCAYAHKYRWTCTSRIRDETLRGGQIRMHIVHNGTDINTSLLVRSIDIINRIACYIRDHMFHLLHVLIAVCDRKFSYLPFSMIHLLAWSYEMKLNQWQDHMRVFCNTILSNRRNRMIAEQWACRLSILPIFFIIYILLSTDHLLIYAPNLSPSKRLIIVFIDENL